MHIVYILVCNHVHIVQAFVYNPFVHIVQVLVYNHVQVHIVQVFVYNPFVQTLHICTSMLDRGVAQLEGQNIKNI